MPVTLAEAQKAIAGAHARAAQLEIRVTVAVVDEGGLLVALGRMDGATPLSPQVAEAKAVGAAMLHRDGASLAELAKAGLGSSPWRTASPGCRSCPASARSSSGAKVAWWARSASAADGLSRTSSARRRASPKADAAQRLVDRAAPTWPAAIEDQLAHAPARKVRRVRQRRQL